MNQLVRACQAIRIKYAGGVIASRRCTRPWFVWAAFLSLSIFFPSCQSNDPQPWVPRQTSGTEPVTKPIAKPVSSSSTTFPVFSTQSLISGRFLASRQPVLRGVLSFPSDNELRWQNNKLAFVVKNGEHYRFFDPVTGNQLKISTKVFRPENLVPVSVESRTKAGTITHLSRTEAGTGDAFVKRLSRVPAPEDFIGLIAEAKYVDGNAVGLNNFEYAGSLRVKTNGCLLNEQPATVTMITTLNGTRNLVIANGEHRLALLPSGLWITQKTNDAGISLSGTDPKLESVYLTLRQILKDTGSEPRSGVLSNSVGNGTGFFITEDGFLITNEHVAHGARQVRVVTSAGTIVAKLVKVDTTNDFALLKVEGRYAALPVVASRAVRLGSMVATVGFPNVDLQGSAPKLARGEIAALSGAQDDARYFQISAPVQPGNSGGALVDERGNVVGVVSAKLSARAALAVSGALPENVNYAVKSSFLLSFLESVPEVSARLKDANAKEQKFEDVVKSAEQAAVLVLVY